MRVGGAKGWVRGNLTVNGQLTGGPFSDGQNWWQLTNVEGFHRNIFFPVFFSFLRSSSVTVCNMHLQKGKKSNKTSRFPPGCFSVCLFV